MIPAGTLKRATLPELVSATVLANHRAEVLERAGRKTANVWRRYARRLADEVSQRAIDQQVLDGLADRGPRQEMTIHGRLGQSVEDLERRADEALKRLREMPRPCPCGRMTINDCAGECGEPERRRSR